MSISHKYRTFDELLESVRVDFSTYDLEGMIEPQQLIKVAIRVNYDLGLKQFGNCFCYFNPHFLKKIFICHT